MDYTMEDTQNTAPEVPESKLGSSSQRNDTQSVTKRYALPSPPADHWYLARPLTLTIQSPS